MKNAYKTLVEHIKVRDHFQELVVNGRILEWILEK